MTNPEAMVAAVLGPATVPGLDFDTGLAERVGGATPFDAGPLSAYDPVDASVVQPAAARLGHAASWRLATDTGSLSVAIVTAAVAQAAAHRSLTNATVLLHALARLAVCLPLLVAVLAGSRHRLLLKVRTTVADQVREVAPPLAAAGLVCIATWRWISELAGSSRPPEDGLLLGGVLGVVLVAVTRASIHAGAAGTRRRRVLIVGSGAVADRVAERMRADGRVEIVGFVDDNPKDATHCLGSVADLADVCECFAVDHVVVAFTQVPAEELVAALRPVEGRLPLSVVPRLFDVLPATAAAHDLASGYPALSVGPRAVGAWSRAAKRVVDGLGATLGLLLALPILVVAAVGVRLSSRGPVLLRQVRVGLHGREFTVWKLRTFTVMESIPPPEVLASGEHVAGPFPKLKHDPRTTPFGALLRRTSIDELPQLLNVLLGTMSLVGPRPLPPEFAWSFGTWALRRYDVKPGLTGLWQVSGRNDLTYEEMCRLDSLYVTNWSLGLDVRVLARTARAVLSGRGCY